eukprot:1698946-Alexandrium_andersonii.AAC.1
MAFSDFAAKMKAVKTEATPEMAPPEGTGTAAAGSGGAGGAEASEPAATGCDFRSLPISPAILDTASA